MTLHPSTGGPDICSWGALPNAALYPAVGASPACDIEWWRFVSSAFLHDPTSVYHVLFNSIAMLFIGRLVEQLYGRLVLARCVPDHRHRRRAFLGCGIARSAEPAGPQPNSISLGASGGIAGLIGLLLMVGRVQGKNVPVGITHTVRNYAVTVIVLNVVLTLRVRQLGRHQQLRARRRDHRRRLARVRFPAAHVNRRTRSPGCGEGGALGSHSVQRRRPGLRRAQSDAAVIMHPVSLTG